MTRLRHDPGHFPSVAQQGDMEGAYRGMVPDDMRAALDDLRDFFSRSSMFSPFMHFRVRSGNAAHDDDDDEDDEEEEDVISFDQMNLPQIEFKEGASEINEKLCVICQDEYQPGDKLSTLPCVHHFHTDCIRKWVDECKPECPLCKAEL